MSDTTPRLPGPAHPRPAPDLADIERDPLGYLLEVLRLEYHGAETGEDVYSGASLPQLHGRVYGGQVLAQSLLAAGATVPAGRLPHSMHGYFLRAGDIHQPVDLAVERLRDGRSFSARRTHAYQGGKAILSMIASFQEDQDGIEHTSQMPDAPDPRTSRRRTTCSRRSTTRSHTSGRVRLRSTSGTSTAPSTWRRAPSAPTTSSCG